MKRIRWKKNTKPTGLARITHGPVGSTLHDGNIVYASVSYYGRVKKWYFVLGANAEKGIPLINSVNIGLLFETEDAAKNAAKEKLKQYLE